MPPMTERQRKAQDGLQTALQEHRDAFLQAVNSTVPEVLTDWILVACSVAYDNDGDQTNSYHFAMNNDCQPDHVSKGLLRHGVDLMQEYGEDIRRD